MRTQDIQFGGDTFVCRIVKSNEGEDLLNSYTTRFSSSQTKKRSGFRTTNWSPNSRRAIPNGLTKANHNQ